MTNTLGTWRRSAALALGAALLLTGCSGGSGESTDSAPNPDSKEAQQEKPDKKPAESASNPDSCKDLDRDKDVNVEGSVLGTCIAEAMRLAKTGTMVLTSPDLPTNTTVFEYVPEYTAYGTTDGKPSILLTKDSGFSYAGNRWIEADPTSEDPSVQMVTAGIKLAKQSSSVEALVSSMSLCPQWVSKGKTDIKDGTEPEGYQYMCEGTHELMGVTISDMNVWLDDKYRMIHQTSIGSAMGITTPSVATISGWGEPVDIPNPADLK